MNDRTKSIFFWLHAPLRWVALFGLLAAVSCATVQKLKEEVAEEPMTIEWVMTHSVISHDDYRQSTSVRGPDFEESIDREGNYYRTHIRAVLGNNGAERVQIYVATHLLGNWHNFRGAKDQDGITLPVSKMARKKQCAGEEGCVYYEHIGMSISMDYLRARVRKGIDLDVFGPGGKMAVVIPPVYVEGILKRIRAERSAMTQKKAGPARAAKLSFCEAKYASDKSTLGFCQQQARASYSRLKPALGRSRLDSYTAEAKHLSSCMNSHNGPLGIDWMMVEHCFGKGTGGSVRPAARATRGGR